VSRHTRGPWTVEELTAAQTEPGEGPQTVVVAFADEDGKEGAILATVNRWSVGNDPPTQESQANARLMAAAPDLLASCRAAIRLYNGLGITAEEVRMLVAAVVKAEGGAA